MRNTSLLEARDSKILVRYTEMYYVLLMRDEEIYKILELEFYLRAKTIYEIVLRKSRVAAVSFEEEKELLTA